jgi:hypothetical protein
MLKKTLFFLVSSGALSGVCAWDFSLGGGAHMGYTFTRYVLESESADGVNAVKSVQKMDRFDYGGFVFLDAVYAEATVSLLGGLGGYRETMVINSQSLPDFNSRGMGYETMLGFSFVGKYPFVLNERWTVFPLLGAEFFMALSEKRRPDGSGVYDRTDGSLPSDQDKDGNPYPLSAWNFLFIKIGAGMDYNLGRVLFLRGEFFYNIRLKTKYETGAIDMVENMFSDLPSPKLSGLTSGPSLRIALGYRLF